jgi:hypothetical protein
MYEHTNKQTNGNLSKRWYCRFVHIKVMIILPKISHQSVVCKFMGCQVELCLGYSDTLADVLFQHLFNSIF